MTARDFDSAERKLIELAKAHDEAAWRELLQIYGPLVDLWLRKTRLPEVDRRDLFQDIFLTAVKKIDRFEPSHEGAFRGWLNVITRSRIADTFRRRKKLPRTGGSETDLIPVASDAQDDLDCNVDSDALSPRLQNALAIARSRVKTTTWTAFWQTVVEERPVADVATDLGVSPSAVRLAKSRVLRHLRKLLE